MKALSKMRIEPLPGAEAVPLCCGILRVSLFGGMLLLLGCASNKPYQIELMPAPGVYQDGFIDPFPDNELIEIEPDFALLYATDRAPATEDDKKVRFYRNERGHLLRLGAAEVELGIEGITWEEARRISLLKNRTEKYPLQVSEVQEFGVLEDSYTTFDDPAVLAQASREPAERYAALINQRLERSKRKDIYLYVHGFKVIFENPVLVAAELWHYLGYEGVFIAYAWPSTPSSLAYFSDLETTRYTARNLRIFLEYLARETTAEHIHIIGYSAGTQIVVDMMGQLALLYADQDKAAIQEQLRLGHVILVGSDVDRGIFGGHVVDGMLKVPAHLTIYSSGVDKALGLSRWIFGRDRIGQHWEELMQEPAVVAFLRNTDDMFVIDVTDAERASAVNGHAYFRQSPWASSDILMTLRYGLLPQQRGLVRTDDRPIWGFPEDYITRLRAILVAVNPELAKAVKELEAPE